MDVEGRALSKSLQSLAKEEPAKQRVFEQTYSWRESGTQATVLPLNGKTTNDRSLVLVLEFGGCRALFTGDIERAGEEELMGRLGSPVHLLKVPHHGSKTSSTLRFLRHYRPRWAVISVGLGNQYGHPNPAVLARYREQGIPLWRTDFHGFVQFAMSSDGRVRCTSFYGSCGVGRCGG